MAINKEIIVERINKVEPIINRGVKIGAHFLNVSLRNSKAPNDLAQFNFKNEYEHLPTKEGTLEGLDLSSSELRLIVAIYELLQEKSKTHLIDGEKPQKYIYGNLPPVERRYNGNPFVKAPLLLLSVSDLTKSYTGKNRISGKETKNVSEILEHLENKKFKTTYRRKNTIEKLKGKKSAGEEMETIKFHDRLLTVKAEATPQQIENLETDIKQTRGAKIILELSPLLVDQLDKIFVNVPTNKAKIEAAGGAAKLTLAMEKLISLTSRMKTNSENNSWPKQIPYFENTLMDALGFSELAQKRKKGKVREKILEAIEVVKKLNIVEKVEIQKTDKRNYKYLFFIKNDK